MGTEPTEAPDCATWPLPPSEGAESYERRRKAPGHRRVQTRVETAAAIAKTNEGDCANQPGTRSHEQCVSFNGGPPEPQGYSCAWRTTPADAHPGNRYRRRQRSKIL